jgi:hypothetical protein
VNSHVNKLLKNRRKMVVQFITVGVIVQRDDEREKMVTKNNDDGWSFDSVLLWLAMR